MSEQRSKRTETEDVSRVDSLLGLLGDLSKRDPSPALRERLAILASQRLSGNSGFPVPVRVAVLGRNRWLRPALAAVCLVAIGLATGLVVRFSHHGPVRSGGNAKANFPIISPEAGVHATPVLRPPTAKLAKVHHPHPTVVQPTSARRMTMRLPYSNGAIDAGTDTTIQVSMSQSELLSLGFPINATVRDRRIVAELTLGDDGLPRAISLPLPLEVMKEKK